MGKLHMYLLKILFATNLKVQRDIIRLLLVGFLIKFFGGIQLFLLLRVFYMLFMLLEKIFKNPYNEKSAIYPNKVSVKNIDFETKMSF